MKAKCKKMGFLLVIKSSTDSTFKIHFQIGGCLAEKIPPLAQLDRPRGEQMCAESAS